MYCDYHTHTPLCLHASGTPQEYVQAAVRAGLREYGIQTMPQCLGNLLTTGA